MNEKTPSFDFLDPPEKEGEIGRLGPYRVTNMVGKGGMGQVFRAEDGRLKRIVALKVMNEQFASTPGSKKRFVAEARSMAAIHHDNVATIFEVGITAGTPFMAMELLKGRTLEDWRLEGKRFSPHEVLKVAEEVSAGLSAAHRCGIVHRDVKAANIWIEEPSGRAKILDFGLALAGSGGDRFSKPGSVVGTPGYLAPEQARNEPLDDRTDLYALGVVLYQMCLGKLPLVSSSIPGQLIAIIAHRPKSLHQIDSDIPKPLSDLIDQLLEKEPRHRPNSATALGQQVKQVAQQCFSESHVALQIVTEPTAPSKTKKTKVAATEVAHGKSMLPWIGLAIVLIAVPALALLYWSGQPDSAADTPEVTGGAASPAFSPKPFFVSAKSLRPLSLSAITASSGRVQCGDAARFQMRIDNSAASPAADPRQINATASVAARVVTFLKSDNGVKRKAPPFPKKFSPKQLPEPGESKQVEIFFMTGKLLPGDFEVIFELQSPSGTLIGSVSTELTVTENLSTGELLGFETLRTHAGGADTYVSNKATEDLGGKNVLRVHRAGSGSGAVAEHAYLRFDLSKNPVAKSEIGRAVLLLTVEKDSHPGKSTISLYGVAEGLPEDWNERGESHLTWGQAPSRNGIEGLRYLAQVHLDNSGEALKDAVDGVRIHGPNLDDFLREAPGNVVTMVLIRDTVAGKPVCFSSKEGKPNQAPALALRRR